MFIIYLSKVLASFPELIILHFLGGFCKDQVYLTGALQLLKYRNEIDFQLLIRLGKISYKDIDKLVDIADLDVTRIPYFMKNQDVYRQKLKDIAIKNGMTDDILQSIEP